VIRALVIGLGVLGMISASNAEQKVEAIWPEGKIPLLKETPPEKIKDSKDNMIRYTIS